MITIKRGDRAPSVSCTLAVSDGTLDLTGATVKFIMRRKGAALAKVDAAASVVSLTEPATVSYAWGATDTDTAGLYEVEWEVTAGGIKRTFPNEGYLYVNVVADLG